MGVNVTTRTVWFAVCQHCTRQRLADNLAPWSATLVNSFASEAARDRWEAAHNEEKAATHPSPDTVVWDVTAGGPVARQSVVLSEGDGSDVA